MKKKVIIERLPHKFNPTGRIRGGTFWATTATEISCALCGLTYWLGEDKVPSEDCPERLKEKKV